MSELEVMSSSQTRFTLPAGSTAIWGAIEPPAFVETITGAEKVTPPSTERLNNTPRTPVSLSQVTKMLPVESVAICGEEEESGSREILTGAEKVVPPSAERENKMSRFPGSSSFQTTLIASWESTAMRGSNGKRVELEMIFGVEKVAPPSEERLKRMLLLLLASSSQTMKMLPEESTAV